MTRKGRRLALIGSSLAVLAVALGLVLFAMRSNVTYFFSPAEIVEKNVQPGTRLRVGGLVKDGSVKKEAGQKVTFAVTDTTRDLTVTYVGLLPRRDDRRGRPLRAGSGAGAGARPVGGAGVGARRVIRADECRAARRR
jgi:cytochrome c-type biogenesis protein CcmE